MSRKSFTAIFPRCDSDVGADGMAAIFNNSVDPSKAVYICEIRTMIRPINPDVTNPLGNQGIISIDRISAVSGGDEVVATKHDTDAADLPSQVKLYQNPDSVTVTETFRRVGDCISSYTILKNISFQAMLRAPGICDCTDHTLGTGQSHNLWHADGNPDTEPIILNAGEGFCLTRREFGLPQAFHFGVTVRVVGTNRTYKYRDGDCGSALEKGMASIALINGTGSGVVLQVFIVSLPDMGEENIPSYRIVRVASGQFEPEFPGTAVTIIPHDTANTLTEIEAKRGAMRLKPFASTLGVNVNYQGYEILPIPVADQQRFDCFRRWLGAGPYITDTGTVTLSVDALSRSEFEIWPGDRRGAMSQTEIVLRPGQGLAVVGGGAGLIETSEQAYLDIEMCGYVEDPYDPTEIAEAVWTRAGRTLT
jgi:hypothetical protein